MSKKLFIVESPGKLKKLRSILGNGWIVEASVGHILEISERGNDKKDKDKLSEEDKKYEHGINMENYLPHYKRCKDKINQIHKLITLKEQVGEDNVVFAADDDREGTMIDFSVMRELGIKPDVCQVAIFNSITEKEIKNSIKNLRKLDMNILQAQQARAVLDKIFGFWVSPILNNCVSGDARSAGRVQSVVVKIVVDRENEINAFFEKDNPTYFNISCDMIINDHSLNMKLTNLKKEIKIEDEEYDPLSDNESENKKQKKNKIKSQNEVMDGDKTCTKIDTEEETEKIMIKMKKALYSVLDVKEKIRKSNPPPPFSTSTLQQFTSSRMNRMTGKETMALAQKLYEAGHITYMRTDSTTISDEASVKVKKYIEKKYTKRYYTKRDYKNKKGNTQEAHECIRPTKIDVDKIKAVASSKSTNPKREIERQEKLYEEIWKRTVQSQMSSAEFSDILIEVKMEKNKKKDSDSSNKKDSILSEYKLVGKIETLTFEGFLLLDNKVPKEKLDLDDFEGVDLEWEEINGIESCKNPPVRYNDATLIKKMDPSNLNIGRPSTYATILDTIQKRKYVETKDTEGKTIKMSKLKATHKSKDIIKESKEKVLGKDIQKFKPTDLGIKVTEFLETHFTTVMNYKFTEGMEKDLDKVAVGKMKRYDVVSTLYQYVDKIIKKLKKEGLYKPHEIFNSTDKETNMIGKYNDKNIYLMPGIKEKGGDYIRYDNKIINFEKLKTAHDLTLKDGEKYKEKNNKKIVNAFIEEIKNPKIQSVQNNGLYEWKIKRSKYILKKSSQKNLYYIEEYGMKDNKKGYYVLTYILNKISKNNDIEINDENINKLCSKVTEEDIMSLKEYYKNKK